MVEKRKEVTADEIITMKITKDLKDRIARIALRYGVSKSMLMRMAICQMVEREEARLSAVDLEAKSEKINALINKTIF